MEVRLLEHKHELDGYLRTFQRSEFLQSWEWGEFYQAQGVEVLRVGVFEGDKLFLSALLLRQALFMGWGYWYCPRGPLLKEGVRDAMQAKVWRCWLDWVAAEASKHKIMFLRCEPNEALPSAVKNFTVPRWVQPPLTRMLDLTQGEAALLAGMKQKARYNLRLGQKKNITVREDHSDGAVESFFETASATSAAHGIRSHELDYYKTMVATFARRNMVRLFLAEYEGQVAAAALCVFYGNTAVYLHGGSFHEYASFMPSYVLQWQALSAARAAGIRFYDFGGVAPADDPKHLLAGVTRFKTGFGGFEYAFPYRYEIVYASGLYRWFRALKKVRALFIKRLRA
ncbi:MAG: hypothetical protein A3F54_00190 [Candidatus Kerfeldbacteria bacterium RIFCSPHIGHO2_12_FULL_48_17]|uniref:BioF2-like acetyltransferase domain-containing protein n=1 Tax=Candidatus Kerfeldbacteria bacterium RIFCSPHIGHO2_12_FULL_48_17 TaxID=1798542 RepID=A0A1G2B7S8_9BACT|nr:MAG: hypothetical protein A3F54_00190 [Candidatus Kerfeldbacteria bacterium RIFCSPHIGHO2_12_FULL_48_17]